MTRCKEMNLSVSAGGWLCEMSPLSHTTPLEMKTINEDVSLRWERPLSMQGFVVTPQLQYWLLDPKTINSRLFFYFQTGMFCCLIKNLCPKIN